MIKDTDTFPLWSFGYMTSPIDDKPNKIMTSRGRTWQEAWICIQDIGKSFREPKKVGLLGVVAIEHKDNYTRSHPYNWLNEAPMWLKISEGRNDLIW